jgi:mRNA-degrading endonuclease toxin of MazEF toxin-antitoxin module
MSKKMERTELSEHCKDAIADLSSLLEHLIQSGIEKMTKRAMLIAYWLKTYVKYLRREDDFSSESVFRLKRGAVVCVEFGYRIGRELGGRHYAVVLDANNSIHSNTVTVVPLGSKKESSKDDVYNAILEDGIYGTVIHKLDALIESARKTLEDAAKVKKEIEGTIGEEQTALEELRQGKIKSAQALIDQANIWIKEITHLKTGSVAKIDQVTTISKMRISQPLKKNHPLYGVRLSERDLDKIDAKLMILYFPQK